MSIAQQLLVPHRKNDVVYADKVKSIFGSSLLAYWPLWEPSGAVAGNYEGTAARDGAYTGVTLGQPGIGDGRTSPLFDGANDYIDIYSANLAGVFSGAEGTLAAWVKVAAAGAWADATVRNIIRLQVNGSNYLIMYKTTTANQLRVDYSAGGTLETIVDTSLAASVAWFHFATTWSKSSGASGQLKAFINGLQVGTTQESLGVWAGALGAATTLIGAGAKTPTNVWSGYIAHVAIANAALSPANILQLATV